MRKSERTRLNGTYDEAKKSREQFVYRRIRGDARPNR